MAFNGSGAFTLIAGNPVVTGTTISSTWANNTLSDIATGLSTTITKDGQTTPTANIPMGGFKITGLAGATANGDAVRYQDVGAFQQAQTFTAFTTAGTTTAYTLTTVPAAAALVANQRYRVKFNAANTTTTPTLAINGLAATALKVYDSYGVKTNPAIGAIALNMLSDVEYDGTDYVVLDQLPVSLGYMLVQDQKAVGTDGGTSVIGVQQRTLNTVVRNTITGASLAASVITLPAGTYRVKASAGCYIGSTHKAFLRDTTNSITYPGSNARAGTVGDVFTLSWIDAPITLTAPANFELRHQIAVAQLVNGLGVAVNVAAAGVEVYASVEIVKEA